MAQSPKQLNLFEFAMAPTKAPRWLASALKTGKTLEISLLRVLPKPRHQSNQKSPEVARGPKIARLLHLSYSCVPPVLITVPVSHDPERTWRSIRLHGRTRFAQKSGLSARGTAASFPEYQWMFSAQTASAQSPRLRP
jgi:hypothetical protein